MHIQEIKLKCLELAIASPTSAEVVTTARSYADFVNGTRDAEIRTLARTLAEKVATDA